MYRLCFNNYFYLRYKWLDGTFPGTLKTTIIKKLVLDQFVLTPYILTLFYTGKNQCSYSKFTYLSLPLTFYSLILGMSLMEGAEDPFAELREKFVPTFFRSCIFWLPAQALNFMFIAPRFRIIYMGICGMIWVNILCYIKRQNLTTTTTATATTATTIKQQ